MRSLAWHTANTGSKPEPNTRVSEAWDENIVLGGMLTVVGSSLRGTRHTLTKELSQQRRREKIHAQQQTCRYQLLHILIHAADATSLSSHTSARWEVKSRGPTAQGSGASRQASLAFFSLCLRFPVCDSGSIIRLTAHCPSDEMPYPSTVPATKSTC